MGLLLMLGEEQENLAGDSIKSPSSPTPAAVGHLPSVSKDRENSTSHFAVLPVIIN